MIQGGSKWLWREFDKYSHFSQPDAIRYHQAHNIMFIAAAIATSTLKDYNEDAMLILEHGDLSE